MLRRDLAGPVNASSSTAPTVRPLTPEAFFSSFPRQDFQRALCGFTRRADTEVVLALLVHARPQRILEIGTAAGHMTANLTEWSPESAQVFSLGVVADLGIPTSQVQRHQDPPRSEFGRFANHFGKVHKALFITADSLHYDFDRLAPLDFVFVDGAHDLEHVLSDSLKSYQALRPGGYLVWHDFNSQTAWVEVRQALERTPFTEPICHVVGTEVAFLCKESAATPPPSPLPEAERGSKTDRLWLPSPLRGGIGGGVVDHPLSIVWEGEQTEVHSLALVNRAFCQGLIDRGHDVLLGTRQRIEKRPSTCGTAGRRISLHRRRATG